MAAVVWERKTTLTVTVELTPEQSERLHSFASQSGGDVSAVIRQMIDALPTYKHTGADLADRIRSLPIAGYGDPTIDSVELARQLRAEAESRCR